MKKLLSSLVAIAVVTFMHAQCQADFGYTNNQNVFTFSDSSTTSSGTISGWFWQFGDNTGPSTQQNPVHTYDACGYYEVTLSIFTSSFCNSTFTDTIFVSQGTMPSFTFTVDTTNGDVNFQGAPNSSTLDYSWDFGDSTIGSGMNVTHNYATSGTYIACLTVSDTGGFCTYIICDTVVVYIAPANCNVTWTNQSFSSGQQTFTAQPFDPNWTYTWDFGDGSPLGNGFITNHQYTTTGTYTVCLTVVDSSTSCTSQFCDTVDIVISCNATWTNQIIVPGQETFTAQPVNPNWTYTWDFGDATPPGNGFITTHTYAAAGTYTVCLTVSDSATSCTYQICDTVNIVFSSNCPVTFTNLYLAGNMSFTPTPLNPLNTYVWDFGDASSPATGMIVNHSYAAPGTYTVCVTMTTFQGCTSTFCDTVIVPSAIGITEKDAHGIEMSIAPNPANENVFVNYSLVSASDVTIEICDITGRVIYSSSEKSVQQGNHRTEINLESFAKGSYVILISTDFGVAQEQLIRQ